MSVKHNLRQSASNTAIVIFLFICSEWKAAWPNLAISNVGESIHLFYLSISLAYIPTHLADFSGKETSEWQIKCSLKYISTARCTGALTRGSEC